MGYLYYQHIQDQFYNLAYASENGLDLLRNNAAKVKILINIMRFYR